jgi:predicted XRE-type DNA-binding protein/phage-related protein
MIEQSDLKPVIWVGSSRKDYRTMPDEVQSRMGYALYIAQQGGKHRDAKPLKGFGGAGVVEIVADHRSDTYRCVYTALSEIALCTACLSEEGEVGAQDAKIRDGTNRSAAAYSRTHCARRTSMSKKIDYEVGSGNVFADIGLPNAEEHLIKAQLVYKIDRLMKGRSLKQVEAAKLFGIKQPDVSNMLRGDFRQFSVERLLRFLVALGQDVEIVVKPHRGTRQAPQLRVA